MIFVVYSLEAMLRYLPNRKDKDLVLYNGLTNTETNVWLTLILTRIGFEITVVKFLLQDIVHIKCKMTSKIRKK